MNDEDKKLEQHKKNAAELLLGAELFLLVTVKDDACSVAAYGTQWDMHGMLVAATARTIDAPDEEVH